MPTARSCKPLPTKLSVLLSAALLGACAIRQPAQENVISADSPETAQQANRSTLSVLRAPFDPSKEDYKPAPKTAGTVQGPFLVDLATVGPAPASPAPSGSYSPTGGPGAPGVYPAGPTGSGFGDIQILDQAANNTSTLLLDTDLTSPIFRDLEVAVGVNHVIAVNNTGLEIFNKLGVSITGRLSLGDLLVGCGVGSPNPFDPVALFDEETGQFVVGATVQGTDRFCFAVTSLSTSDPLGVWNAYWFDSIPSGGLFLDFARGGIGDGAIYVAGSTLGAPDGPKRVWAIDKSSAYTGNAITSLPSHVVVPPPTELSSGPLWPANFHGSNNGTWPAGQSHYFIRTVTAAPNSSTFELYEWSDPFGVDDFVSRGQMDLSDFSTAPDIGKPPLADQGANFQALAGNGLGGAGAEYRNGTLYLTAPKACDLGQGVIVCHEWAQIEPVSFSYLQGGAFGTDTTHRHTAKVTANHCDDVFIGYTMNDSLTPPAAAYVSRNASDPKGVVQKEVVVRQGDDFYCPLTSCTAGTLWMDFLGAATDPVDQSVWFLGAFSNLNQTRAASLSNVDFSCNPNAQPVATTSDNLLDFGTNFASDPIGLTAVIENTGDRNLLIQDVSIAGANPDDFFILSDSGARLLVPGESRAVTIVFDSQQPGEYLATLEFSHNAPNGTTTVDLVGTRQALAPIITSGITIFVPVPDPGA